MKSHKHDRPRAPIKRTPEELAQAHADALLWRAILWAKAVGEAVECVPVPPAAARDPDELDAAQRARFAAAIARAEFGRFYFSDKRRTPARKRKPARNGKGRD